MKHENATAFERARHWIARQKRLIELRWIWYQMNPDERREWLREGRYIIWRKSHGRSVPYKEMKK